jgi:hypothetical protein
LRDHPRVGLAPEPVGQDIGCFDCLLEFVRKARAMLPSNLGNSGAALAIWLRVDVETPD